MSTIELSAFPLGSILGTAAIPEPVVILASKLAREFFDAAKDSNFNEQVETYALPSWLTRYGTTWLPDIESLGYRRAPSRGLRSREELLVASAGCDRHTDGEGLVLMLVLHNDGLSFHQGRVSHRPRVGDWFVFDDRLPHCVKEAKGRAAFLGWNIPIDRV